MIVTPIEDGSLVAYFRIVCWWNYYVSSMLKYFYVVIQLPSITRQCFLSVFTTIW